MNMLSTATQTMSSREIADVVDSRHDSVKRAIERLYTPQLNDDGSIKKNAVIVQPPMVDEQFIDKLGRPRAETVYQLNERESYIVVAQLCPEFTAKLVDHWQATKNQQVALPQNFAQAMRLAADLYEKNEQLAIQRDHAIATKSHISDAKTAKAMNTASQAVKRANKLQAELGRCVENATIIAVKNLTGTEYAWQPLRKWCKAQGVKAVEVVDARFGLVKSWPSAAWSAVYSVTLEELFAA